MIKINRQLLDEVSQKAQGRERKRQNFNFHPELSDPLQRMLNAIEPGTYVHPHKHENPDKVEAFVVLRGKLAVIEYDDAGEITDYSILSVESGNYGVEIPARKYHSLIALEEGTVVYEVKNGPYAALDDKNFAPWAPAEGAPGCEAYLSELLSKIGK